MKIKLLVDEDVANYKKTSMVLAFPYCSFKCGESCQNKHLVSMPDIEVPVESIVQRYVRNPFTSAVVLQGLEPLDTLEDVFAFISAFRDASNDDIVVFTGYEERDVPVQEFIQFVKQNKYQNIILKVGGYIEKLPSVYSHKLGVELASNNQYAFEINC